MSDILLFIALPYIALIIALIGTIYMYRRHGMLVTSLSTQFLESRELFFGGMMMHWSLVFLFFGHLSAFLVPQTVIAWNGSQVRLLILEGTALTFGLVFFTGTLLLTIRRMRNPRLHVLTTDMDIVIYGVLLTQALTGVWIALTYRWGSSWFAAVITPYLRSLFIMQPDIAAISALPVLIKVHFVTAWCLIGIIPFSRFIHFLVFPVRYFWRPYQVVIWNRNRKMIRKSTAVAPELRARNS